MILYLWRKLTHGFLTLWGALSVVFFLFHILPGDPARMMLGQQENSEQLNRIRHQLGFDQPLWKQYFYYLNDLSPLSFHYTRNEENYLYLDRKKYSFCPLLHFKGKALVLKYPYLRQSFQRHKNVSDILKETLPHTLILAFLAMSMACFLGVSLGSVCALRKDTFLDRSLLIITSMGMSAPSFFSAVVLGWLLAFVWQKYTGLNITGSLYEVDEMGDGSHLALKNLILPTLTLGIRPLAVITQLTRNSLLETLQQDYIRTAYAKGLSPFKVIQKHALKNALNPVITAASGWLASMLAGTVFVEYIFGWNGLGKEIVQALNTLDLPVIMGAVLTIACTFMLINLLTDLLYAVLDPRIRD